MGITSTLLSSPKNRQRQQQPKQAKQGYLNRLSNKGPFTLKHLEIKRGAEFPDVFAKIHPS